MAEVERATTGQQAATAGAVLGRAFITDPLFVASAPLAVPAGCPVLTPMWREPC